MDSHYDPEELHWLKVHVDVFIRKRKRYSTCRCSGSGEDCFPDDATGQKFYRAVFDAWGVPSKSEAAKTLMIYFMEEWQKAPHSS